MPVSEPDKIPDSGVSLSERRYCCAEVAARRGLEAEVKALLPERVLALAPGRWLVVAKDHDLIGRLESNLAGKAAVLDQSSAYTVLRLSGPKSRAVLAKLCRIDLYQRKFAVGSVARTLMAQTPVILHLLEDTPVFELFVPITLARSFTEQLLQASREFGCGGIKAETRNMQ